ncbi:threonine aldolase family protein [Aerolutibacter daejeonensis]|uniref:threonine aldolase family protein n=1 Tax=Aerolutibacter daejeonensis TaxID=346181 RepID=UPI00068F56AC|nr:beta-eliminating lyase-related protein [Lysobacter daejeonensis]
MDRRRFLAAGGLTAASPLFAHAATAAFPGARTTAIGGQARPEATPTMFTQVNFIADGLNLRPAEYAALLAETVAGGDVEADNYSLGGAIEQLEQTFARLLGKEAAMFVPTGTLANHLAVRTLAGNDRRVLVQAESHLYADSGDGATTLSGLNLIPLLPGAVTLTVDDVRPWVERSVGGRVPGKIGAISVESPVRRLGHRMADFSELQRLSTYARGQGIRMHLDGARLFNLPQHSGHTVHDYTQLFDTVYVSLWKHFNAASGAILAGDAALINGLYHTRRMFGGSLPHAWPQVAVAQRFAATYQQDYAKAWQAAEAIIAQLRADGRFAIRKLEDGTSLFYMTVAGADHQKLAARARARGVTLAPPPSGQSEFTMQVNTSLLRMPPAKVAGVLIDALAG